MEQNKFEGWTIVGWSSTIPNVTEKEFFDYIHALEPVCSAISWSEWKNPKQLPNLKSYKIQVKEKILNPAPAKPEPAKSDCVCRNKVGTLNHLVSDTGGRFTIISMGKIESDEIKNEAKL